MRRVLLLAMLLGGCSSQSLSDAALPRYQGKSAEKILQIWGAPTRTLETDGGTIYLWENSPPARECRVELHADDNGNTLGYKGIGDERHCAVWIRMLR
jgi:hypothetical protein